MNSKYFMTELLFFIEILIIVVVVQEVSDIMGTPAVNQITIIFFFAYNYENKIIN